jgi:hypothetical protein
MWPHGSNNEYDGFTDKIARAILFQKCGREVDPETILGSNPLLRKDHELSDYEQGGESWKPIKELAAEDKELSDLLISHSIDPNNPVAADKRKADIVLRKIKPIVYFKNYYRKKKKEFWLHQNHHQKRVLIQVVFHFQCFLMNQF